MRHHSEALDVVRAYHEAWTAARYDEAADRLADDLAIDVPINSYPSKASFALAVQRTREMTTTVDLLAEFGNERDAVLVYDMTLPFGVLRVAELFTVARGRIVRIRQIHDTAPIRAAGLGSGS